MTYHSVPFEMALRAASGEDVALQQELRRAFADSLAFQLDLLRRSRCDGNWRVAADRLRGLGSSFHAMELVELADHAAEAAPGEPTVIRAIEKFSAEL